MKRSNTILALAVFIAAATAMSDLAFAYGGRGRGGHSSSGGHTGSGNFSGGRVGGGHFSVGHLGGGRFVGSRFPARVAVFVGVPLLPAWYYYPPPPPWYAYPPPPSYYYGGPAAYVAPSSAPAYIEQGYPAQPPTSQQPNSWYFCPSSKAYYPYAKECPEGWQQVAPQAPPS